MTNDLPKTLNGLKEGKIDFKLKKKKFFGKNTLDVQSLQLTTFGAHSVMEKSVQILGQKLAVHLMIHKATKTKEFEKVPGKKLGLGPTLPPFKTLEEIAAAKSASTAPA